MQEIRPGAAAFFTLRSPAGEVQQIMRWVADERASVACWVSATPCSWRMWRTVMYGLAEGELGSDSTDSQLAVVPSENVDTYMSQLTSCLGGDSASLLRDAEWDAACRVGKKEGFPFLNPQRERPLTMEHGAKQTHDGLFFAVRHANSAR